MLYWMRLAFVAVCCSIIAANAFLATPPNGGLRPSCVQLMSPLEEQGSRKEVVVVGAGIGGLVTAGYLAKDSGTKVTVLEKNGEQDIGGRVNEVSLGPQGEFRFDTGPSLLLLPEIYRETFADLGVDSNDLFEMKRVDPAYQVYFSDGKDPLTLCADETVMERQLEALEEGKLRQYQEYMAISQLNKDVGLPNFIQEKLSLDRMGEFLMNVAVASPLANHAKQIAERFSHPKIRAVLSFQDLYVGLSPYQAPAVFNLLSAIELNEGIYYPVGGFHQVARGLRKVCEGLGVTFRCNSPVQQVLVEGKVYDYEATGVLLESGEEIQADVVVANADLPYVEQELVPQHLSRSFEKASYSTSVIAFYWACNKRWEALNHHTLFLSTDWEGSWDSIFKRSPGKPVVADDFNFYVATASRTDPTVCPEGCDAIMVLVPCSPTEGVVDEAAEAEVVANARKQVIRKFEEAAGMSGFAESIQHEVIYSPSEWRRRYNLVGGSVFGLAHGLNQLSLFRPAPKHPNVKGLYFAGASTRPGNGVPLVMIGSKLVSKAIRKDYL
ncbi:unnamed protein product [Chrysoparadoxa australica]